MDTGVIINVMAELFIMIFIGYALFRTGLFDRNFNAKITKLVLYVAMPALIVSSVCEQKVKPEAKTVYITFGVSAVMFIILPLIGILLAKLIRAERNQQGLYAFMTTYSNIGFMGFPVISSLYGSTAVFYTAIINIIFNITIFTIGVMLFRYGGETEAEFDARKLLRPGVLFSALAIVIYIFNISLPDIITKTIGSLGSTTTPLAMLLMGSTLASMELRQVFNEPRVYVFSIVKQIVIPVILYPAAKFFIKDGLLFGVVMVLLMMPVATNSIMFSIEYGGDEKLAAKSVFISTVMSMFTIPLMVYLLKI